MWEPYVKWKVRLHSRDKWCGENTQEGPDRQNKTKSTTTKTNNKNRNKTAQNKNKLETM